MSKNKYFMVYSLQKAQKLTKQDFPILRVAQNKFNKTSVVFFFEDTPEVREAFNKL